MPLLCHHQCGKGISSTGLLHNRILAPNKKNYVFKALLQLVGWFSGPLRQYFSIYWTFSQRERERGEREREQRTVKMSKQPPPAPTANAIGSCPAVIQNVGRADTGSLPQDHRTTRPPLFITETTSMYTIFFVAPALAGRHRRASFRPFVRSSVRPSIRQHLTWVSCERNSSYNYAPIVLKLCMCFPHGMRMCMWIGHNCWISFCHFFDIVNLVIFHPDYKDRGYLL